SLQIAHVDLRQDAFDLLSLRLVPGRQHEAFAQAVHRLVASEPGPVGGDLEENAAVLAEVDGREVVAVAHGSRIEPGSGDVITPGKLLVLVLGAPCDVVDRAVSAEPPGVALHADVDLVADVAVCLVAYQAVLFPFAVEPHHVLQGFHCPLGRSAVKECTAETPDGVLPGDAAEGPGALRPFRPLDDFVLEAVPIAEAQYLLAETCLDLKRHIEGLEPVLPQAEGAFRNGVDRISYLPPADGSLPARGIREERDGRAGAAYVIAEVQMVRSRIVEVHGTLDETQTQNA